MPLAFQTIVDISLELDPKSYSMRTPAGFKKDMQFEMEVLKEHDARSTMAPPASALRRISPAPISR